jgi:hypothetical protein
MKGLELALTLADEKLAEVEDYFDRRADGDVIGDPPRTVTNVEAGLLHEVRQVRATLQRVIREATKEEAAK